MTTLPPLPAKYATNPVLASAGPVIESAHDVHLDLRRIAEVASWMAYEELPFPKYLSGFPLTGSADQILDFTLLTSTLNFAFTDFSTGQRFEVDYAGATWSDSDALFACLRRAMDAGTPVLDGKYLADITEKRLAEILTGSIPIPMLAQRAEILRSVGEVLVDKFDGRFSHVVRAAAPRVYDAAGLGLVTMLTTHFPRFDDVSPYQGHRVRFDKLAQLAVWVAFTSMGGQSGLPLEDLDQLTAFADYIVPVGLEVMGMLKYSEQLTSAIADGTMIERDSSQEVEIRAHTVYAVALLTAAINMIRPTELQVVMAQVDARLWTHFHTTSGRHHLTRTIMY
ncbi:MAG: queuosine salvage family protein [Nakamurella sp.]